MHHYSSIILCLAIISLSGCCHCGNTATHSYPPTVLRISSGGGVTGQFTGYTIGTHGLVSWWQGFAAGIRDSSMIGKLDENTHRELLHLVYDDRLTEFRHYETGNMTTMLEISSGELLFRIAWPGLWRDTASTPEKLRRLLDKLAEVIDALSESNKLK